MIAEFKVSNFLSIHEKLKLSFVSKRKDVNDGEYIRVMNDGTPISRVAIIHGINAKGKSNMTKALEFFFWLMTKERKKSDEKLGHRPFGLDPVYRNMACSMKMKFYIEGVKYVLSVDFDNDVIFSEELIVFQSRKSSMLYRRKYTPDSTKRKNQVVYGDKCGLTLNERGIIDQRLRENNTLLATFGKANVNSPILKKVYDYFKKGFIGRFTKVETLADYARNMLLEDGDGTVKEYFDKMLKVITPNIDGVTVDRTSPRHELSFRHSGNGTWMMVPEVDESKGVLRFLGMSAILYNQKKAPCFVIYDEIDKELYPDMRLFFHLYFLCKADDFSQMLFTTHTFFFLDRKDIIRRDVIWLAEFGEHCETVLEKKVSVVHGNNSAMKAYDKGDLIDLPFLHDPKFTIAQFRDWLSVNDPDNGTSSVKG